MAESLMVVIDGVRYRRDDAKRRGLLDSAGDGTEEKAKTPKNKGRKAVSNKTAAPSGNDDAEG